MLLRGVEVKVDSETQNGLPGVAAAQISQDASQVSRSKHKHKIPLCCLCVSWVKVRVRVKARVRVRFRVTVKPWQPHKKYIPDASLS